MALNKGQRFSTSSSSSIVSSSGPQKRQTPPKVNSPKAKSSFSYTQSPLASTSNGGGNATPPTATQQQQHGVSPLVGTGPPKKITIINPFSKPQINQSSGGTEIDLELQKHKLSQASFPNSTTNSTISSAITVIDARDIDEINQLEVRFLNFSTFG